MAKKKPAMTALLKIKKLVDSVLIRKDKEAAAKKKKKKGSKKK
jgi:hypothetical protein